MSLRARFEASTISAYLGPRRSPKANRMGYQFVRANGFSWEMCYAAVGLLSSSGVDRAVSSGAAVGPNSPVRLRDFY